MSPHCSVAVCCGPFLLHTLFPRISIQKPSGSFISMLLLTRNQPGTTGAWKKEIPAPRKVPEGRRSRLAAQDLRAHVEIKWGSGYKRRTERWGLPLQLILSAFPTVFLEQVQTGALVPPPSRYQANVSLAWLATVHLGSSSVWNGAELQSSATDGSPWENPNLPSTPLKHRF